MTTSQCYRSPDGIFVLHHLTIPFFLCTCPLVSPKWLLQLTITSIVKTEEVSHGDSHICFFSKLLLLGHTAILNCKEVWEGERAVTMRVVWGQPNHSVCHTLVGPVWGKSISNFLPWAGLGQLNNGVNFRLS